MTVNAKDLPTNNLNINEIEQNTSPNSLELGLGEERKPSQFVLGKDARLLYQSMLEKIVDAAIRLGIPLSLDKQAVLSLLIEGKSTRAIAGELDIETIEAKQYANDAIEELERFMDSFSTIEVEHKKTRYKLELQEIRHRNQLQKLNEKIDSLQGLIEGNPRLFMSEPISLLPITPNSRDVLLREGFFTIGEVLAVPLDELKNLRGMTSSLFTTLKKYLQNVQSRQNQVNQNDGECYIGKAARI